MRCLTRLGEVLNWLGCWLIGLALLALLAIVTLQIVDRHIVDVPITAPDAYARILLIWIAFIGFALAARAGLAIRVDLMDHLLPARLRAGLGIAFDLAKLAMLLLLVVKGWLLVEIGAFQSILGTDLTTAVPNAGLWIGSVLLLVFTLIGLAQAATGTAPTRHATPELRVD